MNLSGTTTARCFDLALVVVVVVVTLSKAPRGI